MKRNIQQRPLLPLGDASILTIVRKYDPTMEHSKLMSELPVYHQHDGYQLVYMVKGQASFMVDEEIFKLSPGDLFFISKNLPHAIVSIGEEPEAIVVQFKEKILPYNLGEIPELKFVDTLLKKGVGGLAFRGILSSMIEKLVLSAGISKVTSLLHTLDYLGSNIAKAEQLSKRIQSEDHSTVSAQAHQYMIEHYKDNIKLGNYIQVGTNL